MHTHARTHTHTHTHCVYTWQFNAVIGLFFAVLFVEVMVMITAGCFRTQINGDEREKNSVPFQDLESQAHDADREKRRQKFETQSRRQAAKKGAK
jgi:hypothetical protein